jgi:proteasome lid subunit RPN8/RPN11
MLNHNHLKSELAAYAHSLAPQEACGLVAGNQFHPCRNIHPEPEQHFAIDAADYARLEELGIQAVFHSHTGFNARFSSHDIRSCKQVGLPWVMYCAGANSWHEMDPTGNAPYLERPWIYGIYDCYGLVRDYYRREFDVVLDDYERGDEFEWTSPEWRMFEKNFRAQGFEEVSDAPRRGDVFLMQLQANYPNHVGILHEPERNVFYQHLLNRLSEASIYGGYWQKCTVRILRHRSQF